MNKRIISMLLCLAMLFSLSAIALAEDTLDAVDDEVVAVDVDDEYEYPIDLMAQITASNYVITAGGFTLTCDEHFWVDYDDSTNVLKVENEYSDTLANIYIENDNSYTGTLATLVFDSDAKVFVQSETTLTVLDTTINGKFTVAGTMIANGKLDGTGSLVDNGGTFKTQVITADDVTIDNLTYTGEAQEVDAKLPTTTVKMGVTFTIETTDTYTITTPAPIKEVKEYTVTFTSDSQTFTVNFNVLPKPLTITWSGTSFYYTGEAKAPTATLVGVVNSEDVVLTFSFEARDDSELTDSEAIEIGSYTATVVASGNDLSNYTIANDELSSDFIIKKKSSSSISHLTYTITTEVIGNGTITPDGDVTISIYNGKTFKFIPDDGYEVFDVSVDGKTQDAASSYTFTGVSSDHSIRVIFTKIDGYDWGDEDEVGFSDVDEDDYFYEAVIWAQENGITDGTGDGEFSPYETCTRAQAVTFFWNLAGQPSSDYDCQFEDISPDDWFYEAVVWANGEGIVIGTSDTTFSPYETCTRAHIVRMIWNDEGQPNFTIENPFVDIAEGDWYYAPIIWAYETELTTGVEDTVFSPDSACSRAHIVTMIYRNSL